MTLNLTNQNIEGDFIVDSKSRLTINLINSTIKGKINENSTAAKLEINLDKDSTITLTGNSYYTSLINENTDGANLINGSYNWTSYPEKEIKKPPREKEKDKGPKLPHNKTAPFNSTKPPHDKRPPFNSTKPPHNKTAPFNSTKPPHGKPHDNMPPFNSSNPPPKPSGEKDKGKPHEQNHNKNNTKSNQTTDEQSDTSKNVLANKNSNGNSSIDDNEEDVDEAQIQRYIRNGEAKLNNYYLLTLILILTIIA